MTARNSNTACIIFASSKEFGGHEKMLVNLCSSIQSRIDGEIIFICPKENSRLLELIESKKRVPSIIMFGGYIDLIWKLLTLKYTPRFIILSAGYIELGFVKNLLFKLRFNCRIHFYLPYVHNLAGKTEKFPIIRDWIACNILYQCFSNYLVIHEKYAKRLRAINSRCEPLLFTNDQFVTNLRAIDKSSLAPERFPLNLLHFNLIGRILFSHKGQDRIFGLLRELEINDIDFRVSVIGDGPDLVRFEKLVKSNRMTNKFRFLGWVERPESKITLPSILLLPSLYEGVPLVLLESIELGIPIITEKFDTADTYKKDVLFFNFDTDPRELICAISELWSPDYDFGKSRFAPYREKSAAQNADTLKILIGDQMTKATPDCDY